jgi:hypothetical protein
MNAIVTEHVPVAELPPAWRAKPARSADAHVTVRIEEESQTAAPAEEFVTDDPAFGIWRDREDMAAVVAYVLKLRELRCNAATATVRATSVLISDEVQLELVAEPSAQGRERVIPADAGIHGLKARERRPSTRTPNEWIPAFAGMTAALA